MRCHLPTCASLHEVSGNTQPKNKRRTGSTKFGRDQKYCQHWNDVFSLLLGSLLRASRKRMAVQHTLIPHRTDAHHVADCVLLGAWRREHSDPSSCHRRIPHERSCPPRPNFIPVFDIANVLTTCQYARCCRRPSLTEFWIPGSRLFVVDHFCSQSL